MLRAFGSIVLIKLTGIRVAYGERMILDNVEFLIRPGDRIGLAGPNGAGKTTLFRVITGEEKPDAGALTIDPGTVIGYFSQNVADMAGRSALAETLAGAGAVYEIGRQLEELEHRMSASAAKPLSDAAMDRYGALQSEYLHRDGYNPEARAVAVLTGLASVPTALANRWSIFPVAGRCASHWQRSWS